jgi:hypothetical protein
MRLAVAAVLLATSLASGAFAQGAAPAPGPSGGPFTFTIPQSRVIVKVSDASLRPISPPSNRPNYFYVSRLNPLLILSGWLEPAARYKGLEALWESEKKSPAMAPPLAPTRVEMLREGKWEVVAYDVPLPAGAQSNLRAQRVEAGTWIDLHISTTSSRPPAAMRAELLAVLRKVEVAEK